MAGYTNRLFWKNILVGLCPKIAVLCCVVLCCTMLYCAVLSCAVLCCACAVLCCAVLCCAALVLCLCLCCAVCVLISRGSLVLCCILVCAIFCVLLYCSKDSKTRNKAEATITLNHWLRPLTHQSRLKLSARESTTVQMTNSLPAVFLPCRSLTRFAVHPFHVWVSLNVQRNQMHKWLFHQQSTLDFFRDIFHLSAAIFSLRFALFFLTYEKQDCSWQSLF